MTPDPSERIAAIRQAVEKLLGERQALRARVNALEGELRAHQQEAAVLKARINELEQENQVLRTAHPEPSGAGRSGTKQRIDDLVDEIDRCLALINA